MAVCVSGYSASLTVGRYTPSETSALFLPHQIVPTRRAVIYAHGANATGAQALDGTTQSGVTQNIAALVNAGLVVLSGDWGGAQTHGNDTMLAAMEGGWAYLQASGLCATDKVILCATSMGMFSASRFAAAHPTSVAGINAWMPAIDIENLRITNALGLRDLINTAWGLTAGSTSQSVSPPASTVPTRGRPLDNLATVEAIPTHLWYSSADTVALPAGVTAYAAGRANVTTHLCSTTADHGDAVVLAADITTAVHFMRSVAV